MISQFPVLSGDTLTWNNWASSKFVVNPLKERRQSCELDRTYVGGIERGERNVALRNIEAIAQTLGITLAELMEGL